MKILRPLPLMLAFLFGAFSPGRCQTHAHPNAFWLPVTDAERQMKEPVVDKDAGVEALFWRVVVGDQRRGEDLERVLYHYVRLKIFTGKGKEQASTVDIEYNKGTYIDEVSGRTIKPDGTILELTKDAVHDRDVVKAGGIKRKARSFAMPGVEPGAIVEYRWRETRDHRSLLYMRLQFQREFPVQKVTYFLKALPREVTPYVMGIKPFNFTLPPMNEDTKGYTSVALEKTPAFREEPLMPGQAGVRIWALLYYSPTEKRDPVKYWPNIGKKVYKELRLSLRADSDLKQAAAQAVEGAAGDEEKALRLLRYLRANLRDLFDPSVSDADRLKAIKGRQKQNGRAVGEILKSGVATSDEMNLVFAAMASQVGLDARPALVGDRDDIQFHPSSLDVYFLPNVDMAVRIGGSWKIYDVSTRLLPPRLLSWREEGASALVTDPDKPEFISLPLSPPEESQVVRKAKLTLDAEGAIEGDIEEAWSGHKGAERRGDLRLESEARRQERIREEVLRTFPSAELTGIQVEHVDNPEEPLRVRYHLKVTGYAQRTGKRLLFQPLFFQRGSLPLFTASNRRYDIHFRYAWREQDEVAIVLPPGFELEKAETPGNLDFGPPGSYGVKLSVKGRVELSAQREFVFGRGGALAFGSSAYPQIKRIFEEIHARDGHILALRQSAAAGAK